MYIFVSIIKEVIDKSYNSELSIFEVLKVASHIFRVELVSILRFQYLSVQYRLATERKVEFVWLRRLSECCRDQKQEIRKQSQTILLPFQPFGFASYIGD